MWWWEGNKNVSAQVQVVSARQRVMALAPAESSREILMFDFSAMSLRVPVLVDDIHIATFLEHNHNLVLSEQDSIKHGHHPALT